MDRIQIAQQAAVTMVMDLRVLDHLSDYQFLKKSSAAWNEL
jgi:hypothetical protein